MDSSTVLPPSMTTPSAGILPPGLMITTSPIARSSIPTVSSDPSLITVASSGAISRSFSTASSALDLVRCSRCFPTEIRVSIMAEESKHSPEASPPRNAASNVRYMLYRKAHPEPMDTKVSIVGLPDSRAGTPLTKNLLQSQMTVMVIIAWMAP